MVKAVAVIFSADQIRDHVVCEMLAPAGDHLLEIRVELIPSRQDRRTLSLAVSPSSRYQTRQLSGGPVLGSSFPAFRGAKGSASRTKTLTLRSLARALRAVASRWPGPSLASGRVIDPVRRPMQRPADLRRSDDTDTLRLARRRRSQLG